MYTAAGKASSYDDIPLSLFVQGYLIIMRGKKEGIRARMALHLGDLMGDAELYGWARVRTYHAVWVHQLEQGQVTWDDKEKV